MNLNSSGKRILGLGAQQDIYDLEGAFYKGVLPFAVCGVQRGFNLYRLGKVERFLIKIIICIYILSKPCFLNKFNCRSQNFGGPFNIAILVYVIHSAYRPRFY
jgi:hypothetical protein